MLCNVLGKVFGLYSKEKSNVALSKFYFGSNDMPETPVRHPSELHSFSEN